MRKPLPSLLVFTDPVRTPDLMDLALRVPRGAALVYRAFGAPDAETQARRLKALARQRGFQLWIGADSKLAYRVGADGIHLPERLAHLAMRLRHAGWRVTAAAHSARAARAKGVDAVVVSAVFPSASPSAGRPMGPLRLAEIVSVAGRPVYALGGVNARTAKRLLQTGIIGIAGIDSLRT